MPVQAVAQVIDAEAETGRLAWVSGRLAWVSGRHDVSVAGTVAKRRDHVRRWNDDGDNGILYRTGPQLQS